MNEELKTYISDLASKVDSFSEKYQVVHAAFAIEQMLRDRKQEQHDQEIEDLVSKIAITTDRDQSEELIEQVKEKKKENNTNCRIIISYVPYLNHGCARIHRTSNDTFFIGISKSLECIRKPDNTIDFERLNRLRKLMAHELGHIVLHSGILDRDYLPSTEEEEELEANYFAECLIKLRDTYNDELKSKSV